MSDCLRILPLISRRTSLELHLILKERLATEQIDFKQGGETILTFFELESLREEDILQSPKNKDTTTTGWMR